MPSVSEDAGPPGAPGFFLPSSGPLALGEAWKRRLLSTRPGAAVSQSLPPPHGAVVKAGVLAWSLWPRAGEERWPGRQGWGLRSPCDPGLQPLPLLLHPSSSTPPSPRPTHSPRWRLALPAALPPSSPSGTPAAAPSPVSPPCPMPPREAGAGNLGLPELSAHVPSIFLSCSGCPRSLWLLHTEPRLASRAGVA